MQGVLTLIEYPICGVFSRCNTAQNIGGAFMEKYGERLKAARKARGYTQTELAEKLGITQKSYQRMETGAHDLKMSTIYQLCTTLNISSDWLIGLKINIQ